MRVLAITAALAALAGASPHGRMSELAAQGNPLSTRPFSVDDILTRRDIQEIALAPNGERVAVLVRRADLPNNSYRMTLFVITTAPAPHTRRVLEEPGLSQLRWTPDGNWVSYLSAASGSVQLWRVDPNTGKREMVFHHLPGTLFHSQEAREPFKKALNTVGVSSYEWSPSGSMIAFTSSAPVDPLARRQAEHRGIVYDDEGMGNVTLTTQQWIKPPTELWSFEIKSRRQRRIWAVDNEIAAIAWAPDEQRIAVSYLRLPVRGSRVFFNYDLGLVSVRDGAFHPLANTTSYEGNPVWDPNGRAVAFVVIPSIDSPSVAVVDVVTRRLTALPAGEVRPSFPALHWPAATGRLYVEAIDSGRIRRGKSSLYLMSSDADSIREITPRAGHLSKCSFSQARPVAACIRQTPDTPPEIVMVNLLDGLWRRLAGFDPVSRTAALGAVEELHWSNRDSVSTNAFLIKPTGWRLDTRYPTLVILYGFEGRFLADAEWITSYPAQVFAAHGFAVLLINSPRYSGWQGDSFEHGGRATGYGPLASIEAGVRLLIDRGIADSTRLGILGWSYGAFLAEFALAHSSTFQAASVGDGGDYNPGVYWLLGRRANRDYYERVMGGPPYGATLKNWITFSPALNADRVTSPVLMEFNPVEALHGLEMFTALRRHGVPTEMVIYPGEGHVFDQPQHRYWSMRRNLQWFTFWLKGEWLSGNWPGGTRARWEDFRDSLRARNGAAAAPDSMRETRDALKREGP